MFPYDQKLNNDWSSMTLQSPKKYTTPIMSKKRTKNNISDIFFSMFVALAVAVLSTTIPPFIYFFRLNLL